ncbi:MAG: thioredoxin family protein, partial [Thermodesulfobacteriota bacterium]
PCPYCKTMKGVLEKFGKSAGNVKLFQINGLENPASAKQYGVERFPDLLFLRDGEIAARQKGLTNPQGLKKLYREMR